MCGDEDTSAQSSHSQLFHQYPCVISPATMRLSRQLSGVSVETMCPQALQGMMGFGLVTSLP